MFSKNYNNGNRGKITLAKLIFSISFKPEILRIYFKDKADNSIKGMKSSILGNKLKSIWQSFLRITSKKLKRKKLDFFDLDFVWYHQFLCDLVNIGRNSSFTLI